jgi:GNAT superfamily N-acetyltransferase
MTTIRPATERDAAGIATVYVEAWRSAYAAILPHRLLLRMAQEEQARQWAAMIRDCPGAQSAIVASDADEGVVGFASFGPGRVDHRPAVGRFAGEDAKVGEVHTLYVLPDFQERGIGRELLAAAFAALAGRHYDCGFVWALRDNHARYFYERVGGKLIAERQERMWGVMTDQVCYGWTDLAQVTATHSR